MNGAQEACLRRASAADIPALAALQLRSWHATYDRLLEPSERARLTLEGRLDAWRRRFATDPSSVWLIEAGGLVRGFVSVQAAEDRDLEGRRVGEVASLHVAPELHSRGLGRRLLARGEAALRESGFPEAVLWVLADNEPARAFYERLGWRLDGAHVRRPMGGQAGLPMVDEVRYRRTL